MLVLRSGTRPTTHPLNAFVEHLTLHLVLLHILFTLLVNLAVSLLVRTAQRLLRWVSFLVSKLKQGRLLLHILIVPANFDPATFFSVLLLHRVETADCLAIGWELVVEVIDANVDHFAIIYLVLGGVKLISAHDHLVVMVAQMQAQALLCGHVW